MHEIIFPGDSITSYRPLRWPGAVNAGRPGENTEAILKRIDGLIAAYPQARLFHIQAGTNDLTDQWPQAAANVLAMLHKCRIAGIPALACKVPPRAWDMAGLNDAIEDVCLANGFRCLDYFTPMCLPDGNQDTSLFIPNNGNETHPNAAGYVVMDRAADEIVSSYVPKPPASMAGFIIAG